MIQIQKRTGVFLLTVATLEGYKIDEYYGVVTGSTVYGANFIKDFFAKIGDTVGGRISSYEKVVNGSIEKSLLEMAYRAKELGANAVLGIDVDTSSVGNRMLMASCYGTAVHLSRS